MSRLGKQWNGHVATDQFTDVFSLQSVEMISADIQVTDSPPYYHVTSHHHAHSRYNGVPGTGVVSGETSGVQEGAGWAAAWRTAVQRSPCHPVPLPLPAMKLYYANMKDMLRAPIKQPSALHRYMYNKLYRGTSLLQTPWDRTA